MSHSQELPHLKMVALSDLVLHEDADPRRVENLARRIREDGRLKNPPIVAPLDHTNKYVVLDGANRVSALRALNVPHAVVQVVSYGDPDLRLETWYHVVTGLDRDEFLRAVEEVPDLHLKPDTLDNARVALAIGDAVGYIAHPDHVYLVYNGRSAGRSDIRLLNDLVNTYKGRANIHRTSNDVFEQLAPYYSDITALVVFPRYQPADIMALARGGEKVPSGITRHIIPCRALRINIPLSVLESDTSLEEKRRWLEEWLRDKMAKSSVRYYSEPTYLFDE